MQHRLMNTEKDTCALQEVTRNFKKNRDSPSAVGLQKKGLVMKEAIAVLKDSNERKLWVEIYLLSTVYQSKDSQGMQYESRISKK